jgi:hypothetical protein
MKYQDIDHTIEQMRAGLVSPIEQLNLCRKRIKTFRQPEALVQLVTLCVADHLAVKFNRVILNLHAMLHFASLSDEVISDFMAMSRKDAYIRAFTYFGVDQFKIEELLQQSGNASTTTVELNIFLEEVVDANIYRINNLASTRQFNIEMVNRGKQQDDAPLYSATDIRERAILYFAALSSYDKFSAMNDISMKYGFLLTRLNEKQYNIKLQNIRY